MATYILKRKTFTISGAMVGNTIGAGFNVMGAVDTVKGTQAHRQQIAEMQRASQTSAQNFKKSMENITQSGNEFTKQINNIAKS